MMLSLTGLGQQSRKISLSSLCWMLSEGGCARCANRSLDLEHKPVRRTLNL